MIIDDPDQFFLYLVSIPLLTGNISCLRKLITISLYSPPPPLSLSLFKGRDLKVLTVLTPPLQLLPTFLLSSFKIQGGGCFSSNKEFLLWNSVESILNQYDTLNLHYEASNLKTRVKCNQLYMYMRISG